jgi:hypothetical protein
MAAACGLLKRITVAQVLRSRCQSFSKPTVAGPRQAPLSAVEGHKAHVWGITGLFHISIFVEDEKNAMAGEEQ